MALKGDVCVVTGASGFLGKRLIRVLLEEESMYEIRLVDKEIQLQLIQSLKGKDLNLIMLSYVDVLV